MKIALIVLTFFLVPNLYAQDTNTRSTPDPEMYWGDCLNGKTCSKEGRRISIGYRDGTMLDSIYVISSIELQVPHGITVKSQSPFLTYEMTSEIDKLESGSRIAFLVTVRGPDAIDRRKAGAFIIE